MTSSSSDPQVTITIDTAYKGAGVDAANKGLESVTSTAQDLKASLDDLEQSNAPARLAGSAEQMSGSLQTQPPILRRIGEGWQRVGRVISVASESLGKVMWVATIINGTIELGRKLWEMWHRDAIAAREELERIKDAIGELDAKIAAARKSEHARAQLKIVTDEIEHQNRAYEDRLTIMRRIAEAESTQAQLQAERAGRQVDVDKERLRTRLIMGSITQQEYDAKVAKIDLEDRERLRREREIEAGRQIIEAEDKAAATHVEMMAARSKAERLTKLQQEWGLDPQYFARTEKSIESKDVEIDALERKYEQLKGEEERIINTLPHAGAAGHALRARLSQLRDELGIVAPDLDRLRQERAELSDNYETRKDILRREGLKPLDGNYDGAAMALQDKAKKEATRSEVLEKELHKKEEEVAAAEKNYDDILKSNAIERAADLDIYGQQTIQRDYAAEEAKATEEREIIRKGNIAKAANEIERLKDALAPLEANAAELAAKSEESRKSLSTYGEMVNGLSAGRARSTGQAIYDKMERYLANADKGLTDPDAYRQLRRTLNRSTGIPDDMRAGLLEMLGDAARAGSARAQVTTHRSKIAEVEERKAGYEREPQLEQVADNMDKAAANARKAFEALADKATTDEERVVIKSAASSLEDGYQTSDLAALQSGAQHLKNQGSPLAGQYIAQVQSVLQIVTSLMHVQQQLGSEVKAAQRSIDSVLSRLGAMSRAK